MKQFSLILIIGILLGIIISEYTLFNKPVIAVKPTIVNHVVAKLDTVYLTIYKEKPITVASADTMLGTWGLLNAKYYFPPANYFDFKFTPAKQVYNIKWYNTRTFGFVSGVVVSSLIIYLAKK